MNQLLTDAALGVFKAASDAIIVVDADGVITLANPMAHTMFGYPDGELEGAAIEALVPENRSQAHRAHRLRYRADPKARVMGDQTARLSARRLDVLVVDRELA